MEVLIKNNMFNFNENINPIILFIATMLRIGSAVYFYKILRKAMILVGIKNGLIVLRKLLLTSAIVMFITAILSIFFSVIRPFLDKKFFGCITDILTIINAAGFYFLSYMQYKIQSFQYSPRQLELHSKIADLEKKENDMEGRREVARIKINRDRRQETKERNNKK